MCTCHIENLLQVILDVHILLFQVKLYKKEERAMWNPPGLPIMPGLLRYRGLAVVHYSGVPFALHLQHAQ